MRIVCQQTILMKYAIFVILEKEAKFKIGICCKLKMALYGFNVRLEKKIQFVTIKDIPPNVTILGRLSHNMVLN